MSLGPPGLGTGVGGHGAGSAILVPSCCHLIPGEQGRAAATHSAMGNKLPLHLFPVKGWAVVLHCHIWPIDIPHSCYCLCQELLQSLVWDGSSGRDRGTDPQAEGTHIGQVKVTAEQPRWCPGLVPTQHTEQRKPRDVAAGILHTPHNGFMGVGKVEGAGICPWEVG